jgi:hypothetical protein
LWILDGIGLLSKHEWSQCATDRLINLRLLFLPMIVQ